MQLQSKKITTGAMLAALALIFSYVEAIIPFQPGIPGIKLGLANLVIIIAMYRLNMKYAAFANIVRIFLAGLLFSGTFGILYSLAGSIFSFFIMWILKKTGLFSVFGVSMAGGAAHNMGQLFLAMMIVSNAKLLYYFPVLLFSGMAAGIIVGIGSSILIIRIPGKLLSIY